MALPIELYNGKISGSIIGLKVDGYFVSCEVSSDFTYDVEMKPTSSTESGNFKDYIPGKLDWQMSVSANTLLRSVGADFKTIFQGVLLRRKFDVEFSTRIGDPAAFSFKGKAFAMNGNVGAQRGQTSQWTVTFKGTGAIELITNPYFLIINAMPAPADKPYTVNTTQW